MPDPNDPAASVLATGQAGRMSVAYLRALYGVGQAWAIDYVHITFRYVCYSYSCGYDAADCQNRCSPKKSARRGREFELLRLLTVEGTEPIRNKHLASKMWAAGVALPRSPPDPASLWGRHSTGAQRSPRDPAGRRLPTTHPRMCAATLLSA